MIELTPYTAQSIKRYELHEEPITGSLLTPEETASAFAQHNAPGCRVNTLFGIIIFVVFAVAFVFAVIGLIKEIMIFFVGAVFGSLAFLFVLIGIGVWRTNRKIKAWQVEIEKLIDFPSVAASAVANPLGTELPLNFTQHVRQPTRIETIKVQVVMIESATYTSGTDTYTDTREIVIDEDWRDGLTANAGEAFQEAFKLTLRNEPHTLHTWYGGNNKVTWRVRLNITYAEGNKPPALKMDYILDVLPQAAS